MTLLALLVAVDAALHFLLVARFGIRDRANLPFLIFACVYLLLAIAIFLAWPYALWATLVLTAIGLAGLTATFDKPQRSKGLDRSIWVVDVAVLVLTAWRLFAG